MASLHLYYLLLPCLLTVAFLFPCPTLGTAQSTTHSLHHDELIFNIKQWTRKDGLPQRDFEGGFQDSRGIVWLAFQQALYRFDGQRFIAVWEKNNVLHNFHNSTLNEDGRQNIWWYRVNRYNQEVEKKISIYAPNEDKLYTLEEYVGEAAAEPLLNATLLYFFRLDQCLYISDPFARKLWCYSDHLELICDFSKKTEKQEPRLLVPASDGYFWGIHDSLGVQLLERNGRLAAEYPMLSHRYHFLLDEARQLYFYQHSDQRLKAVKPPEYIIPAKDTALGAVKPLINLSIYSSHKYYEIPDTPISLFDNPRATCQLFNKEHLVIEDFHSFLGQQLPNVSINLPRGIPRMYIPLDNGHILIPTIDKKLLQIEIKPRYFQPIMEGVNVRGLEIKADQLFAISASRKSHIYEVSLKDKSYRIVRAAEEFGSHFDLSLENGQHLIGTGRGQILETTSDFQQVIRIFYLPEGTILPGSDIRCILHRPDSLIWHSTYRGIVEVDQENNQSRYILLGYNIYWLHEDDEGIVWAGTNKGIYNTSNQTFYLTHLPDGQALRVAHIYQQNPQTFWLSTHQGLIRWRPYSDEYERYTEEDGLSNNILHAVYEDQRGRLWISSNDGIMSFDLETATIIPYFNTDGLPSNEQNWISHTLGEDGRLYFGGLNGISSFHPDSIPLVDTKLSQAFTIGQLRLYNSIGETLQSFAYLEEEQYLSLPRACRQLSIDLIKPYFGFQNLNIEWRIPTESEHWQRVNEDNQIFLLNLPYGEFDIELRAWTLQSKNSPAVFRLHLYNPFPIYMMGVFWIGMIAATLCLFYLIYRWRSNAIRANNRRLNEEVRKRTQELEAQKQTILAQNKRLERIDEAKNRLFNNISHELRSPLTLIQVSAEQLVGKASITLLPLSEQIKQQTQKMTSMIEDIMNLSRVELGVLEEEKAAVDWNSLIKQQFSMFESLAHKKRQRYQLELTPEDGFYTTIDPKKAETVLNNLINNAIKYTPEGGHIIVQSKLNGSNIEVSVQDTGPGIEAEEQQEIFNRYYQGKASKGLAEPGYGIGLALCKEYIMLMEGRIWVESEPSKGATFKFVLPLISPTAQTVSSPESAQIANSPAATPEPAVSDPDKPYILIAEDNAELRQLLVTILSDDYNILLAENGQQAYELLQAQPKRYSLVLSDIMMPILDGYGLLQKTRAHPQLGFIPFLMLTALSAEEDKIKALRLGVDAFLTKPFETLELKTRIQGLIENQKRRTTHSTQEVAGKTDAKVESYDEAWLQELEATVRENMGRTDYKVTDMAHDLLISERTLRNYIKAYTGLTPSAYLQKARLDQAYLYFKSKKYRTVAEVAYAVGFKNSKYFSKLFKKAYGISPSDCIT
jgi:signal transduction histidine kinase/DNA-binding response OmpR family regulator